MVLLAFAIAVDTCITILPIPVLLYDVLNRIHVYYTRVHLYRDIVNICNIDTRIEYTVYTCTDATLLQYCNSTLITHPSVCTCTRVLRYTCGLE